ncbi:MAG TPA: caspase family protein [Candidatus Limiplasma sp.]|nr:caspase family protein [Candidatus Limiplasma sp.]
MMKKLLSLLLVLALTASFAFAESDPVAASEIPVAAAQEAAATEPPQETVKEAVTESVSVETVTEAPVTEAPVTEAPVTEAPAETQAATAAPDTQAPTVTEAETTPAATETAGDTVTETPTATATETPADTATPAVTASEPAVTDTATPTALPTWKAEEIAALFTDKNTLVCTDESMLESDHPYAVGVQLWTYTVKNAITIDITFDEDTEVAPGDQIAILEGGEIYTLYAADDLAGKTVRIYSDTVRIALLAVSGVEAYGFAVKTVAPTVPQKAAKIVPLSFSATLVTAKSVKLQWQGDGAQIGFALYRKASGQSTYTLLGKLGSTVTAYTDTSLPQYKNVEYRLFALDSGGSRGTEYLATYVYSLAATKVTAARATTGTKVAWNKVSGASGYYVLRRVNSYATYSRIGTVTSGSTLSFYDTTADKYSTVTYRVQAYRTIGSSTFDGLISGAYTLRLNFDKPAAPTVTTGLGYATIKYAKVSGASDYLIYRKVNGGSYARIADITALTYIDRSFSDGDVCTYLVRPRGVVTGRTVTIASAEAIGYVAKTLTLSVERISGSGTDSASLSWTAVPNAARYRLMRYCSDGTESEVRIVVESDILTYTDTGLAMDKQYYYTLRPYTNIGGGQYLGGPTGNRVYCDPIRNYRALLIGQMYTGSSYALHGTENDRDAIGAALSTMTATDYAITEKTDLTGNGILSAIQTAFSGATENDVSLFFYSGHGVESTDNEYLGALCGTDIPNASGYITPTKLRTALDSIPGTKIVIIDACHSGNIIGKNTVASSDATTASVAATSTEDEQAINQIIASSFISAFATSAKSNLATGGYYVLVAAHSTQTSIEMWNGYKWFGYFTTILCQGSGYDEINNSVLSSLYADANSDSKISLSEAYNYVIANTGSVTQVAQVYPTGSSYVLYGR